MIQYEYKMLNLRLGGHKDPDTALLAELNMYGKACWHVVNIETVTLFGGGSQTKVLLQRPIE